MTSRNKIVYITFFFLILLSLTLSVSVGAYAISPAQVWGILLEQIGISSPVAYDRGQEGVFLYIRLPRVLLGMLVGAALSVSGAGMQGLFRNPLADPGLIGISAGAVLAAAITIVLGWNAEASVFGYYVLAGATFIGALVSTLLVFRISRSSGKTQVSTMLLAGIAINALAGALTGFLIYMADDEQLRSITFWSLGSLGSADWTSVSLLLPLVLIPSIVITAMAGQLDAYTLGEEEAHCLGVNIQRMKNILICMVTLAVGASIALTGMIGFIGLVIPHITRMLLGASHKNVIIGSALVGAVVLTIADLLCRTLVSPAELPIGILTAMMGTPLFIYLLMRQKGRMGYV